MLSEQHGYELIGHSVALVLGSDHEWRLGGQHGSVYCSLLAPER